MRRTLRRGDNGSDVAEWQRVIGVNPDGWFGMKTEAVTRAWQSAHRLTDDGIVGPKTWSAALVPLPRPPFGPLNRVDRAKLYGSFAWSDDDNDGWIKIEPGWQQRNIVRLDLPLSGVIGWRGHDLCHALVRDRIVGFFDALRSNGLLYLVKSWGGCWAPRRIRTISGFSPNLSNHAWGTAFDINVAWNGLGKTPAPEGTVGSVIELLPFAYASGLYWGGLFSTPDGMHFEAGDV